MEELALQNLLRQQNQDENSVNGGRSSFTAIKVGQGGTTYHKVSKFLDARKLCCNLPKIPTKGGNLRVFRKKDANGIANSEDPDQTGLLL